jgi:hypothetical protein
MHLGAICDANVSCAKDTAQPVEHMSGFLIVVRVCVPQTEWNCRAPTDPALCWHTRDFETPA